MLKQLVSALRLPCHLEHRIARQIIHHSKDVNVRGEHAVSTRSLGSMWEIITTQKALVEDKKRKKEKNSQWPKLDSVDKRGRLFFDLDPFLIFLWPTYLLYSKYDYILKKFYMCFICLKAGPEVYPGYLRFDFPIGFWIIAEKMTY